MKVRDFMGLCTIKTLVDFEVKCGDGFNVKATDYFKKNIYTYDADYGDWYVVGVKALRENEIKIWVNFVNETF